MIAFQHGRADWVDPAYPVTGPAFSWDGIEWVVIHYTAAIDLPDGDMGEFAYNLPPYLRAIQREYLRRGYSIGYNAAVDWLGGTWELRGDTFKCAANADREDTIESPHDKGGDENARTFAILMLVDDQDGATPLAAAAVRGLVAQIRAQAPRAVVVLGHRDVDKTQCPGTGVYAQIRAGVFEPVDEPIPAPAPEPPPDTKGTHNMWCITKTTDGPHLATSNLGAGALHISTEIAADDVFAAGGGYAVDFSTGTGKVIAKDKWSGTVAKITKARALELFGPER